jgi:hypothetical protein
VTDRRTFLELSLGTASLAALEFASPTTLSAQAGVNWDLSWTGRLQGKRRAIFDIPEIESGYGIWRAVAWKKQYSQVLNLPADTIDIVAVLRHNGIALAMNQAFWERYNVGADKEVKDPLTTQPTKRNPVIDRTGENALPEQLADFTLENFLKSGGIALGCALAFRDCIDRVAKADGVDAAEAEKRARSMIVPGVILQPSGVFAATLAQDFGCRYVRAS